MCAFYHIHLPMFFSKYRFQSIVAWILIGSYKCTRNRSAIEFQTNKNFNIIEKEEEMKYMR